MCPVCQDTEAAFLKKRRKVVADSASGITLTPSEIRKRAAALSSSLSTAATLREETFQKTKHYKNKIQAYLDDALVESEIDEELVAVAEAWKARQTTEEANHLKKHAKAEQTLNPTKLTSPQHHPTFVEGSLASSMLPNTKFVTDEAFAEFFVAADPGNPSPKTLWTACLQGGVICNAAYFRSNGNSGIAFVYDAATVTKRRVYISREFEQEYTDLVSVVKLAAKRPKSRWTFFKSKEDFVDGHLKACGPQVPQKQKRFFDCIALLSAEQARHAQQRNMFDATGFVHFVRKLACASRGMCGA